MKKIMFLLFCFFCSAMVFAQDSTSVTARDNSGLRSGGKIYVVVAVLITILCGLFIYVIRLDRKIAKLEKSSITK